MEDPSIFSKIKLIDVVREMIIVSIVFVKGQVSCYQGPSGL